MTARVTTKNPPNSLDRGDLRKLDHTDSVSDSALDRIKSEGCQADEYETLRDADARIKAQEHKIREHLDQSIALMFMTFITCYRTCYTFKWVAAQDQYGGGRTQEIFSPQEDTKTKLYTQAAHPSIFPCLLASTLDKVEFVWQKHSSVYAKQNATNELFREVNQVDTKRDIGKRKNGLRDRAIHLVNNVSRGSLTPRDALRKFHALYVIRLIEIQKGTLYPKRRVIDIYLNRLKELNLQDEKTFDELLYLQIEGDENEMSLRTLVYRNRFELIKQCQDLESEISRQILLAQNTINGEEKKSLSYVDCRLRYAILKNSPDDMKPFLNKLLCTSLAQLEAKPLDPTQEEKVVKSLERFSKYAEANRQKLGKLYGNLRESLREMRRLEHTYRASVIHGIRKDVRGYTGKTFTRAFKEILGEQYAMSPSTLSRLEALRQPVNPNKEYLSPVNQRRVVWAIPRILNIAKVLNVDPGVILPSIVSSMYK